MSEWAVALLLYLPQVRFMYSTLHSSYQSSLMFPSHIRHGPNFEATPAIQEMSWICCLRPSTCFFETYADTITSHRADEMQAVYHCLVGGLSSRACPALPCPNQRFHLPGTAEC